MPTDPPRDADDRPGGGATSSQAASGPAAADADPAHDDTTSREAYEREMAEQGRSDEAGRHGDHIE